VLCCPASLPLPLPLPLFRTLPLLCLCSVCLCFVQLQLAFALWSVVSSVSCSLSPLHHCHSNRLLLYSILLLPSALHHYTTSLQSRTIHTIHLSLSSQHPRARSSSRRVAADVTAACSVPFCRRHHHHLTHTIWYCHLFPDDPPAEHHCILLPCLFATSPLSLAKHRQWLLKSAIDYHAHSPPRTSGLPAALIRGQGIPGVWNTSLKP